MQDTILKIVQQLVAIDNRNSSAIAREADVSYETIRRLRKKKVQYIHSRTAVQIASACRVTS